MLVTEERVASDPWLGADELPPLDDDHILYEPDAEPDISNPPDFDIPDTLDMWVVIDNGAEEEQPEPVPDQSPAKSLEEEAREHLAAESVDAYEQQFGVPMDLFAPLPIPKLNPSLLPDPIAAYAMDQAQLIGVIPAMIAFPCLTVAASAIDDGIILQPKKYDTQWRESARIWVGIVADPSARKSPSIGRAVGVIKKRNMELKQESDAAAAKHKRLMDAWSEAKKQAIKNCEEPPPAPEAPPAKRTYVEDVTLEMLGEILKDNPRGIMYYKDELTGWFGSMGQYKSGGGDKDRADWLEAYNGGSKIVDRITRGTISVPNWSACVLGGVQPGPVRKLAANSADDGLMQRFMMIVGANAGKSQDRPPNQAAIDGYRHLIQSLFAIEPSDTPVMLSEGAAIVRDQVEDFATLLKGYESFPPQLRSHIGKWEGLWARLTLLYHVIECSSKNKYPNSVPVRQETAEKVFQLIKTFILPNALAFYCYILGDNGITDYAKNVAGYILSKNLDELKNKNLVSDCTGWRYLPEWQKMNILRYLQDNGWILPKEEHTEGRRLIANWAVNPAVHRVFDDQAIQQRRDRKEVVKIIRDAVGRS